MTDTGTGIGNGESDLRVMGGGSVYVSSNANSKLEETSK